MLALRVKKFGVFFDFGYTSPLLMCCRNLWHVHFTLNFCHRQDLTIPLSRLTINEKGRICLFASVREYIEVLQRSVEDGMHSNEKDPFLMQLISDLLDDPGV